MTMTEEAARALRAPFDPAQIGKLPRAGIQLDYVGHAAVTDRLLSVDPEWTWEPCAVDEFGLPKMRKVGSEVELWIRLTVCGVTRIGVGVENEGTRGDIGKKLVSDALRNAAMRFGVALDLWSKEELIPVDNGPSLPEPSAAYMRMVDLAKTAAGLCGDSDELKATLFTTKEFGAQSLAWPALADLPDSVDVAIEFFSKAIAECEDAQHDGEL